MQEIQQKFGMPIIKSGVRVLRPDEWLAIWDASGEPGWVGCHGKDGRVIGEVLMFTGMRYVEAQRFQWNGSKWFDGKFVFLPTEAIEKHKRKQLERWIRLNKLGVQAVEMLLRCSTRIPSWWTWTDAMKRWAKVGGLDPKGLGPKTTRKTWESWLMTSYPEHWMQIVLNQGHTSGTSLNHYLNMPFLPEDKESMKLFVQGFF